ncbi:pyridoxamine 5'-phosphate oxidase family protein [Enterococcus sp. LJL99]
MLLHERITHLLGTSTTFLIATLDQRGFPSVITVSEPLFREGLLKFQFYLDGSGETVQNILKNPNGSICCYKELEHESLLLKGQFSVELIESIEVIQAQLLPYQKELKRKNPVIVTFETWTAKIHVDKRTHEIIV